MTDHGLPRQHHPGLFQKAAAFIPVDKRGDDIRPGTLFKLVDIMSWIDGLILSPKVGKQGLPGQRLMDRAATKDHRGLVLQEVSQPVMYL